MTAEDKLKTDIPKANVKTGKHFVFLRNLLTGIVVAMVLLGTIECLLRILNVDPSPRFPLINSHDVKRHMLFADDTGNLADTVIDNIVNNHFTTPDSHLIFRVRQNEEQTPMFKKIGINALGFRGRLISERKGGIRILILGDSCAYGWGITDIAETFPGRLEKLLAARGIPTEIYNLSQPGYSTTQGLILYREWQPIIKPDVLILYFGWNDIWNSPKLTDRQTISLLRVVNQPFI